MRNLQSFKKIIGCLVLTLSILSCSENKDPELEISVSISNMGIIGGTGYSCYDIRTAAPTGSVSPYRVFYPRLKIKFGVDEQFFITGLKIKLRGANASETTCQFSDLEIQSLFNATMSIPKNGQTSENPEVLDSAPQCRINCGGISITDDSRPANLSGSIILDGYYIKHNDAGEEVEAVLLRAMTPVSANYTP